MLHVTRLSSMVCRRCPPSGISRLACSLEGRLDVSVVAERIHNAYAEVCIENQGRPAAAALSDFVSSSLLSIHCHIPLDTLLLELEYGSGMVDAAGYRLTHSDQNYRRQWLITVLMTSILFKHICQKEIQDDSFLDTWSLRDPSLFNIVAITLQRLMTQKQDEQIRFDRSLATKGISGGVATQCIVLPPQFVPITQLVLLTVKHLQEQDGYQPS